MLGSFDEEAVRGFPSGLAGDPLGSAPVYTHVYPGEAGEVYLEYWLFYGHDRAGARFLGVEVPYGGHRGDWEHVAYRVRVEPPELLAGFYYGHDRCIVVAAEDLEVTAETHPVVYVSQGKHASYPAACVVPTTPLPRWLVAHDDVANGRGPAWDSWTTRLLDLGELEHYRKKILQQALISSCQKNCAEIMTYLICIGADIYENEDEAVSDQVYLYHQLSGLFVPPRS